MNPARLAELRRQRELLREHMAWLEREIARAGGETPAAVAVEPAAADALTAAASASLRTAETYRPDPLSSARQVRRGCLLYAAGLFVLGFLALTLVYFVRYRDHPVLFVPSPDDHPPSHAGSPPRR
jgi:hypothetical protein